MHFAPGGRRFDAAKPDEAPTLFRQTELRSKAFSSADFETRQVFVTSRDGTRVPMFIVARKGLTLSGDNPCLLYGYGGEPAGPPGIWEGLGKSAQAQLTVWLSSAEALPSGLAVLHD